MVRLKEARRARNILDSRLGALGSPEAFAVPRAGWIRAIRDSLGMTAAELGRRLGVTHAAVFELERSERNGSARLATLRRAAAALDCELVYALIPRRGLVETVRSRAETLADEELARVRQTMALEDQAAPVDEGFREELIDQLIETRGLWDVEE
jgi:predicted DNA-binding mobile mystery protein A